MLSKLGFIAFLFLFAISFSEDQEKIDGRISDSLAKEIYKSSNFYISLIPGQKEVYDSIYEYMLRYAKIAEFTCDNRGMFNIEYAHRDTVKKCMAVILERFKKETPDSRFISLMKRLKIKEEYWGIANQSITFIIQDVLVDY